MVLPSTMRTGSSAGSPSLAGSAAMSSRISAPVSASCSCSRVGSIGSFARRYTAPPALCTPSRSRTPAGAPTRTFPSMNTTRSSPPRSGRASGMRSKRRVSTAWATGDAATASSPSKARRYGRMGCFMGKLLEALVVPGRPERVARGIDVHPRHLDGVAHQGALDLLGAVVLVGADVQRHHPVAVGDSANARCGVVAVAAAGDLVDAAHALAQLARAAAVVVVGPQEGLAGRGEVRRKRVEVARVVLFAIRGPAVERLKHVEREGIDGFGRHFPPLAGAAGAQVGRYMDGRVARCVPPAAAHHQGDDDQRAGAQAQRLDVRLQVGDLVFETAHRSLLCMALRVDQKPEREISRWPPTQPAASGCLVAMRHCSCRYSQVSGRPRLSRRRMPPPTKMPRATPRTTNVGAIAIVRNTQDSGAPISRPAAAV